MSLLSPSSSTSWDSLLSQAQAHPDRWVHLKDTGEIDTKRPRLASIKRSLESFGSSPTLRTARETLEAQNQHEKLREALSQKFGRIVSTTLGSHLPQIGSLRGRDIVVLNQLAQTTQKGVATLETQPHYPQKTQQRAIDSSFSELWQKIFYGAGESASWEERVCHISDAEPTFIDDTQKKAFQQQVNLLSLEELQKQQEDLISQKTYADIVQQRGLTPPDFNAEQNAREKAIVDTHLEIYEEAFFYTEKIKDLAQQEKATDSLRKQQEELLQQFKSFKRQQKEATHLAEQQAKELTKKLKVLQAEEEDLQTQLDTTLPEKIKTLENKKNTAEWECTQFMTQLRDFKKDLEDLEATPQEGARIPKAILKSKILAYTTLLKREQTQLRKTTDKLTTKKQEQARLQDKQVTLEQEKEDLLLSYSEKLAETSKNRYRFDALIQSTKNEYESLKLQIASAQTTLTESHRNHEEAFKRELFQKYPEEVIQKAYLILLEEDPSLLPFLGLEPEDIFKLYHNVESRVKASEQPQSLQLLQSHSLELLDRQILGSVVKKTKEIREEVKRLENQRAHALNRLVELETDGVPDTFQKEIRELKDKRQRWGQRVSSFIYDVEKVYEPLIQEKTLRGMAYAMPVILAVEDPHETRTPSEIIYNLLLKEKLEVTEIFTEALEALEERERLYQNGEINDSAFPESYRTVLTALRDRNFWVKTALPELRQIIEDPQKLSPRMQNALHRGKDPRAVMCERLKQIYEAIKNLQKAQEDFHGVHENAQFNRGLWNYLLGIIKSNASSEKIDHRDILKDLREISEELEVAHQLVACYQRLLELADTEPFRQEFEALQNLYRAKIKLSSSLTNRQEKRNAQHTQITFERVLSHAPVDTEDSTKKTSTQESLEDFRQAIDTRFAQWSQKAQNMAVSIKTQIQAAADQVVEAFSPSSSPVSTPHPSIGGLLEKEESLRSKSDSPSKIFASLSSESHEQDWGQRIGKRLEKGFSDLITEFKKFSNLLS